jgi:hypothetical protein
MHVFERGFPAFNQSQQRVQAEQLRRAVIQQASQPGSHFPDIVHALYYGSRLTSPPTETKRYKLKVKVVLKTHVAPDPLVPSVVPVQWFSIATLDATDASVVPAVIVPDVQLAQHHSFQA